MIDNATLLIAIAFSSGALMVTLFVSWFNDRSDRYLVSWGIGMGLVVISLGALGYVSEHYDSATHLLSYALLLTGLVLTYAGTYQFRTGGVNPWPVSGIWAFAMATTVVPFLMGQTGWATIALNVHCAALMAFAGYQYWQGRAEAPAALAIGTGLFSLTGLSFLACALVLLYEGAPVLDAPPNNWAEQVNSIMAIVGLTGLGALSLTLHQSRHTRRHRNEAHTDSLTDLLNRRALFERFAAGVPAGAAVLMFDIDHFKQINDRYGHAAGDAVIKHFANIVSQNLRSGDVAARIGGEEFCATLEDMKSDQAKAIGERIRSEFEASPAQFEDLLIRATVSVGLASHGKHESFSSVLSRADHALYKAKEAGRNRVSFATLRLIA